jgi:hypothetical protein
MKISRIALPTIDEGLGDWLENQFMNSLDRRFNEVVGSGAPAHACGMIRSRISPNGRCDKYYYLVDYAKKYGRDAMERMIQLLQDNGTPNVSASDVAEARRTYTSHPQRKYNSGHKEAICESCVYYVRPADQPKNRTQPKPTPRPKQQQRPTPVPTSPTPSPTPTPTPAP